MLCGYSLCNSVQQVLCRDFIDLRGCVRNHSNSPPKESKYTARAGSGGGYNGGDGGDGREASESGEEDADTEHSGGEDGHVVDLVGKELLIARSVGRVYVTACCDYMSILIAHSVHGKGL